MQYDPVKQSLGRIFNRNPFLRKIFYRLLDLLLLRSWHIRRQLKSLKSAGFSPAKIADAGSGFGQYVFYLSKLFPEARITGLDIKQDQVDDCNRFFNSVGMDNRVIFEVADLTALEVEEQWDLVLSVDVMEHIEEDRTVLKRIFRGLKPGGVLLISTPSDQGGSDVHHEHDTSFIDEHVRDGYGVEEMDAKLREAGFSEVEIKYSYGKPGSLSWRLSMKYPITAAGFTRLFLLLLPVYYLLVYPVCFFLNFTDVRREHTSGTGLIVKCSK